MTAAVPVGAETEQAQEVKPGEAVGLARSHAHVSVKRGFWRSLGRPLRRLERRLSDATRLLPHGVAHAGSTRAAEWLLDNAHLVAESLARVRDGLPPGFYRRLPRLDGSGEVRVRQLAVHLVASGDGYVDPNEIRPFLTEYQRVTPLTIGELWALPSMLRWALLEGLERACAELLGVAGDEVDASAVADPAVETVAAAIRSLHGLEAHDWRRFFEATSMVERVLRRDPASVYHRSDKATRDACRKVVESTASVSELDEVAVAEAAVDLAAARQADAGVGHFLLGDGRAVLERTVGARPGLMTKTARALSRVGGPLYFSAVGAVTGVTLSILLVPAALAGEWGTVVLGGILGSVPASAVGVAVVNWVVTRLVRPGVLPKLEIRKSVPEELGTVVAVPALLSGEDDVPGLMAQLELNYQGNPLHGLSFALLADFPDADSPFLDGDDAVLTDAVNSIRELNARYGQAPDDGPFLLFSRGRRWNPCERRWMGWERKRGKLMEFSRLLLGHESQLRLVAGNRVRMGKARYVLSLDADTVLPQGAASRLIGTAGHPLNRPVFDSSGRVVAGYTVFQPRVETSPGSVGASLFARLFEGERGLDLYSHAVSDVYQDLFHLGIYAGKGIFDVAAFHRSLEGRVPENAILSHDLFEGLHGRAALVSDVAVFEDYPAHVSTFLRRLHRWVRGDWQIVLWLSPRVPLEGGGWGPTVISPLGRWQIGDNLRRSLLMPSLLLLLLAGWTFLAGPAWWWTVAAVLATAVPLFLDVLGRTAARVQHPPRSILLRTEPRALARGLARWAAEIIILPSMAIVEADAVARTLVRVAVTRRNLLEWTSFAHDTQRLDAAGPRGAWRVMPWIPVFSIALALGLALFRPEALLCGGAVLVAWSLSPWVARWLSRPLTQPEVSLSEEELRRLRALAYRTWGFFERFLTAQDQWLPPDHVQEYPNAGVAHRSSPTNVGLGMLSVLGAWDLGYLSTSDLAATLSNVMDALEGLERHRGHLFNWYDTHQGAVLPPRFVSTVDSGNLAACLITLARGCETAPARAFPDIEVEPRGVLDALEVVWESAQRLRARAREDPGLDSFGEQIRATVRRVGDAAATPRHWAQTVGVILAEDLPVLEAAAVELVEAVTRTGRVAAGAELRTALQRLRHQLVGLQRELEALVPWLLRGADSSAWAPLLEQLPDRVAPADAPEVLQNALSLLDARDPGDTPLDRGETRRVVEETMRSATTVVCELELLARRADAFVGEMDFTFLYNRLRKIFHVGYDVDAGRLAASHYDLLASEARIASFVAIAKGDVPHEHWLHLRRPFARAKGRGVLLSWSGTLFEYLMPELMLRTPDESLLDFADRAAVDRQIAFARRHGVPWGTSESAYQQRDHEGTYQYRAFGVPELAIRRDVTDRIVVAPYASVMALRVRPGSVVKNLEHLARLSALGQFGLYEALDFPRDGGGVGRPQLVRSWMAHHQGMILIALTNLLSDEVMVERFHRDRRVRAAELLLHERVPGRVPARPSAIQVRAAQQHAPTPPPVRVWEVEPAVLPQAHVLSNGQWSTLLTDRGAGGSRWRGQSLTRWRADPAMDEPGVWIYLEDLDGGPRWSAARAPTGVEGHREEVSFGPQSASFRRTVDEITSRLAVFVAPTVPVEVRCLRLANAGGRVRRVGVTSYGEVVLAPHAQDRRHPAFVKLFVDSSYKEEAASLVFRRRPGMRGTSPLHLVHAVVSGPGVQLVGWETDRRRFLGRTGGVSEPKGLAGGPAGLRGVPGATLDPVFALGCEVDLLPFGDAMVTFLTSVGRTEEEAMAAMERLRSPDRVEWALTQVEERARLELHRAGIHPDDAHRLQKLLTGLSYPYHTLRGRSVRHRRAPPRQAVLWSLGISGDVPILLLRVPDADQVGAAEEILRLHAHLLRCRVEADLVVLDETAGEYADPVRAWLQMAVARHHGGEWLGRRGGVHHVAGGRLDGPSRSALEAAASVALDTSAGSPGGALHQLEARTEHLPVFVPMPSAVAEASTPPLPALPADLLFFNGVGGFTPDGREYVIRVSAGAATPAPWLNVIANRDFGFTVSERGAGFTWSGNSGEHRLTPWSNDPVTDRPGEALYLRDEETGEVWSPTPGPAPADQPYEVRHGAGYTTFSHHSHGLAQHVELFVPRDAPVKIARLRVRNLLSRPRRITATSYVEWVLGNHRDVSAPHVVTELLAPSAAVLARGTFARESASRIAFHAASLPLHGATGDRLEFLGGPMGRECPAGLDRVGLGESFGAGLDPCAALQVHLDLGPEEEQTLHFLLGEGESREAALEWIGRFHDAEEVERARVDAVRFWDDYLGQVEVRTPEPGLDVLLNRWLPYQALVCRLWARSALYQSSGAFGFRDQLQDTLSLLHRNSAATRDHILEAARHQFLEGDVLHWWHPSTGEGVRTRCSDDLLWLPWVTAAYVEATGDEGVLEELVPFLEAPPLEADERERYQRFSEAPEPGSLYEHCMRALLRGATRGEHGLPLMGTGDWNDGMDRVGEKGSGESVWLAWFLHACLNAFLPIAESRRDEEAAAFLVEEAERLRRAVEETAWDGDWYRRGYYDDGTPLGSATSDECRIDSLTQSWAVLSGAANPGRARKAVATVLEELVREQERLVLLLAPPFDHTNAEPGYIKAYPPGIRENGGQYTHAAVWLAWACADLGDGAAVGRLLRLLNPILRTQTPEDVEKYRVEPYVVAADIYGVPPHEGRGGWTWYTGSSGWLYRLGIEAVIGIRPSRGGFRFAPCIPPDWPGCEVTLRRDGSEVHVRVENPHGGCSRVASVTLDGHPAGAESVPLRPGRHEVVVRIGAGPTTVLR